ncbi:MAG: F0F1 ATP synthase subunit gamma [Alphaproteobacteria bacterium]|nr:MAG: F0F1 ATP synthase subunit gamma [Alphaproteobacteria bacterium]
MTSLREIQSRVNGLKTTEKITTVMKMIAITKYRKLSQIFPKNQAFVEQFQKTKQYFKPVRKGNKKYLVTFEPARGLCSSLNTKFARFLRDKYQDYSIISIKDNEIKPLDFFEKIVGKMDDFSEIKIAYIHFASTSRHLVQEDTLFPWAYDEGRDFYVMNEAFNYEAWLKRYLALSLNNAFLSTQISENAARMLAMDSASKNAEELIRELKLSYNKKRQEMITKEIAETGCSVYGE